MRGHDWYDFEAKYLDDACDFDVPADLPADVTAAVRDAACVAFTALDCAGLARVDFFVTPDDRVVVNEVNTHAGLHADLDVPADVGGHRRPVPRAGRPVDPVRPAAPRR